MAQGKQWTDEEKDSIIQSLKPFLEMGLSRNKACEAIGLPPQTLSNWVVNDDALGMKLRGYENTLNYLAISNIASALQAEAETEGPRKDMSTWWAERRMKEAFSTRTENTGADGKDLPAPILVQFIGDDTKDNTDTDRV